MLQQGLVSDAIVSMWEIIKHSISLFIIWGYLNGNDAQGMSLSYVFELKEYYVNFS